MKQKSKYGISYKKSRKRVHKKDGELDYIKDIRVMAKKKPIVSGKNNGKSS